MKQISDIKVASSDGNRERIFRFRYDVYVTEMGKSPTESDHQKKIICDELDEDAHRYSTFSAHSSLSYLSNIKF